MIPIGDNRSLQRVPVVTMILLLCMVIIFLWHQKLNSFAEMQFFLAFGLRPNELFGDTDSASHFNLVKAPITLITYAFLHGGWVHLIGNCLFLWVFGPAIEDAIGSGKYVFFFAVTAAISGFVQAMNLDHVPVLLIGSSGAVSGIIGAYIILFPNAKITVLFPTYLIAFKKYQCSSKLYIGIWFSLQLVLALYFSKAPTHIAFLAHVSGFIFGALIVPFLKRREIPLFDGQ